MTQEENQLLIDLCGRVPYNCMVECSVSENIKMDVILLPEHISELMQGTLMVKPYLRPMSSMTEEEKEYVKNRWYYEDWYGINDFFNNYQIDAGDTFDFVDWLNKKMFDYRGLIPMGLALESPKDMYEIK